MTTHTVAYTKTHLSRLLHDVEAGREITIVRGDTPVARLVPSTPGARRRFGTMSFVVPEDFDEPMAGDELAAWE